MPAISIDGDVVGLSTNPAFVEALLVGANHQTTAELRWRNIPLVTRWSPLRKFWQRKASESTSCRSRRGRPTPALGNAALAAWPHRGSGRGFRTSLFRRYPATVVYLYPARADLARARRERLISTPRRVMPTFTGTIGADITFFGFPVAPAALATHWVVLEEPPAGYRFYTDARRRRAARRECRQTARRTSRTTGSRVPVRVLIGPLCRGRCHDHGRSPCAAAPGDAVRAAGPTRPTA